MIALIGALVSLAGGAFVQESEVQFPGAGGLMLAGTLVRPAASFSGPRPAVLLLPGSGPTDRDGNQLAGGLRTDLHKQIAESLAKAGIASLRFDKRATARYRDSWPKTSEAIADFFDWPMFAGDATAAYRFLCAQSGIDSSKVAICGHSEGGLIALQVAADLAGTPTEPAALVLLSTGGRPMGAIIHEQLAAKLPEQTDDATARALLAYSDEACANLAAGKPIPPNTPPGLRSLFNPSTTKIMGSYCRIDPAKLAEKYTRNALVVNGIDDTQVNPRVDAPRLRDAFELRRRGTVKMVLVPDASHNYKSTATGNHDAFGGTASPVMLGAVVKFLTENLG